VLKYWIPALTGSITVAGECGEVASGTVDDHERDC
jgi:hypothetical protein